MKQIKIMTVLLAVLIIATNQTQAQQGKTQLKVSHSIGIPVGSFTDAVEDISPRGGNISILYGISDKISLGGNVGFQDFYQKFPRQVYTTSEGSHISAVLSNSIQVTPVLFTGQYNFLPGQKIQPYASLGIGGNIITYSQLLGAYTNDSRSKVAFAAKPEVGINFPVAANRFQVGIGAAFNYMPFNYGGIDNLNNLSIQGGISFPLRR